MLVNPGRVEKPLSSCTAVRNNAILQDCRNLLVPSDWFATCVQDVYCPLPSKTIGAVHNFKGTFHVQCKFKGATSKTNISVFKLEQDAYDTMCIIMHRYCSHPSCYQSFLQQDIIE